MDVAELKLHLQQHGYWRGAIDDCYDAAAQEAVRKFQRDHGLEPTAVVDEATWAALGQGLEVKVAVPDPAPPAEGAKLILIDTNKLTLTLYVNGQPYKTWPVAVGRPTSISPVGEWRVANKGVNVGGPFGSRWMGLNVPWGIYGIHGTNAPGSIGTRASGGCIRMHNRHVEELYPWVPVGTPVVIIGVEPVLRFEQPVRPGMAGPLVVKVQSRMAIFGFDPGYADGRFKGESVTRLRELETYYGLRPDGVATTDTYFLLGLR
jgi:peptidoglycan hydrolase-like protein with peptidoglycan-binding domain